MRVEPICLSSPRPADAVAVAVEADGCRMAAELGADIIKVMYPDDPDVLGAWCAELGVRLVILGGPAEGTAEHLCAMVEQAVAAGARGITIGRRVWRRPIDEATELLQKLSGIVPRRVAAGRRRGFAGGTPAGFRERGAGVVLPAGALAADPAADPVVLRVDSRGPRNTVA